jgi:two-component system NarL family sensor kinase
MQPPRLILYNAVILTVLLTVSSMQAQSIISPAPLQTIETLKQMPPSFGRDTALVVAYKTMADYRMENDLLVARAYADSARIIAEHIRWEKGMASTYMTLAHYYGTVGYWDKTNTLIQQSIQISKRLGDKHGELAGLVEYGLLYWDAAGNYDKSLATFRKCLTMATAQKDTGLLLQVYYQIGYVYMLKKEYKQSLSYLDQHKVLIEKKPASLFKRRLLYGWKYNVAQIYLLVNRVQEAETMLAYAMPAIEKEGTPFEKYYSNWSIADAYLQRNEYKKAKVYAEKTAYYARFLPSRAHDVYVNTVLYKTYKGLNQSTLALRHLEELRRLESKMAADKTTVKIEELQLKYDTKAQQAQIDQLTIDRQNQTQKILLGGLLFLLLFSGYAFYSNRRLLQKNRAIIAAQLKGQTLERQRVAADLHDNLGTTLSALRWNLEAMDTAKLTSVEQAVYATINQQVGQAYNDVRLLSHNLLPNELAKQGLAVALNILVDKMNRNTPVHFSLNGADTLPRLDTQTEFELYSICLELLNNTIKHAQATEGFIDLSLTSGTLHLNVGDNGMGLANQRIEGRGLQNVAARVEALGGTWQVEAGQGVAHRISVPVRLPAHASWRT